MKYLALAIIVSTVLVIDFLANIKNVDSHGWDATALVVCILAAVAWRS